MFLQMIIPGVDEYLARGIQNLGEAASLFFKTDRRRERAIQDLLAQNPELIQKFADLEANAPGTLENLRFGKGNIGTITQTPESTGSQLGRITRPGTIRAAESFVNEPQSAGRFEDLVRGRLGLPTRDEESVSQRTGDVARAQNEALENLPTEFGPMGQLVDDFLNNEDDPQVIQSILAHPIYSKMFEYLVNYRTTQMKEEDTGTGITAEMKNRIAAINPVRRSLRDYSAKVREFMKHPLHERLAAFAGQGPLVQELGNIQSIQSGLMGTFRPLLSPGPLSRADMAMLQRMLGNVVSPQSFIRGESYVEGQLQGVESFVNNTIEGLRELAPGAFPPETTETETPPPVGTRTGTGTTTGTGQQRSRARIKNGVRTDTARIPGTRGAGLTPRTDSVEIAGFGKVPTRTLDALGIRYNYDIDSIKVALRRGER